MHAAQRKPVPGAARTATLPDTPVVPSVRGTTWPEGFTAFGDEIELERTIRLSERTRVTGRIKSKGGETVVKIDVWNRHGRCDEIPIEDLDKTVVAMNILKEWIAAESARLVIAKPEPKPEEPVEVEDEEGPDEE